MSLKIRPADSIDLDWIRELLVCNWGDAAVVTRGKRLDASSLPGFIAEIDSQPVGLITYHISNNHCEIVTLNSLVENLGVGSALTAAVIALARKSLIKRVWLITTNDNEHAIEFYKRRGFELVAIHCDAVTESRKLKPQIPEIGKNGIPISDELEFELTIA